jgi:hypothetical protein
MALKTSPYITYAPLPEIEIKRRKVRNLMARRTAPDEKGYSWTMGYNTIVGRWTQGIDYGRFSGSSYNRSLKKCIYDKDLATTTKYLITMANKVSAKMFVFRDWQISSILRDCILRQDDDSKERYRTWLQSKIRMEYGSSFGMHILSQRSRAKVKDKATAFFRSCPGSRVLCTISFIKKTDDRTGVSILNKFLTAVREEFPKLQYLWVAERQENRNIHFHVIMNKRLPVKRWNALLVLQQYNAGLVGKNLYGETISKAEIDRRYADGSMQDILNPLDLKKIDSIGGLASYLTTYITKQPKNAIFDCNVWHCSRGVSRLFTRDTVGPSTFRSCLSFANAKVDRTTGEMTAPQIIKEAFYIMAYIHNKEFALQYLRQLEQANRWIMEGMVLDRLPMCNDDDYRKYFTHLN